MCVSLGKVGVAVFSHYLLLLSIEIHHCSLSFTLMHVCCVSFFSLFLNPFVDLLSLVSLLQAKHTFSSTVLFSSPFATFHYSYLLLLLFCSLSLFPLFSPYFPNHHPILLLCFFFSNILHFLHCSLSNLADPWLSLCFVTFS